MDPLASVPGYGFEPTFVPPPPPPATILRSADVLPPTRISVAPPPEPEPLFPAYPPMLPPSTQLEPEETPALPTYTCTDPAGNDEMVPVNAAPLVPSVPPPLPPLIVKETLVNPPTGTVHVRIAPTAEKVIVHVFPEADIETPTVLSTVWAQTPDPTVAAWTPGTKGSSSGKEVPPAITAKVTANRCQRAARTKRLVRAMRKVCHRCQTSCFGLTRLVRRSGRGEQGLDH